MFGSASPPMIARDVARSTRKEGADDDTVVFTLDVPR
jgi:hypothetical protein